MKSQFKLKSIDVNNKILSFKIPVRLNTFKGKDVAFKGKDVAQVMWPKVSQLKADCRHFLENLPK